MKELLTLDASPGLRRYGQYVSREQVPEFEKRGFKKTGFGVWVGDTYRCFMVPDEP